MAMPMDEDGNNSMERSSSLVPTDPLNSNDNTSADDLAWAESCLVKLSEASDSDWSSYEVSMLEILNGPTETVTSLIDEDGNFNNADFGDDLPFPSDETIITPMSDSPNGDEEDPQDEEDLDDDAGDTIYKKKKKWLKGEIVADESPLLLGHAEFLKVESTDSEFDFGSTSFEHEISSSQDIFKVWDVGVSDEQLDEFTEKLHEALKESTVTSGSDDDESQLDFATQSVDDLTAGVSKLSLG